MGNSMSPPERQACSTEATSAFCTSAETLASADIAMKTQAVTVKNSHRAPTLRVRDMNSSRVEHRPLPRPQGAGIRVRSSRVKLFRIPRSAALRRTPPKR